MDIMSVVSKRVRLMPRPSGAYIGLCPFHEGGLPSLMVSPSMQFFHCLTCKASGDGRRFARLIGGSPHIRPVEDGRMLA